MYISSYIGLCTLGRDTQRHSLTYSRRTLPYDHTCYAQTHTPTYRFLGELYVHHHVHWSLHPRPRYTETFVDIQSHVLPRYLSLFGRSLQPRPQRTETCTAVQSHMHTYMHTHAYKHHTHTRLPLQPRHKPMHKYLLTSTHAPCVLHRHRIRPYLQTNKPVDMKTWCACDAYIFLLSRPHTHGQHKAGGEARSG